MYECAVFEYLIMCIYLCTYFSTHTHPSPLLITVGVIAGLADIFQERETAEIISVYSVSASSFDNLEDFLITHIACLQCLYL